MKKTSVKKNTSKLSGIAILLFIASLTVCSLIISATIINRVNVEKLQMEQLILEKTLRINNVISRLLYKTNSLATLIVQGNGTTDDFYKVAPSVVDDPAIFNVLAAPNGIVTNVYPLDGNEAVIGLDFFSDGIGNKEAVAARDKGSLVLGGPFLLIEGIQALVGRLPVYIDTQTEKHQFWGLVSITLKFPQALNDVELGTFTTQGFAYELWRINPDTNERQIISNNYDYARPNTGFVEMHVPVLNADWYLKVWPIRMWHNYPENIVLIIAGLLISLLILFVMQNNTELRKARAILEQLAKTDPLTEIYNRRHFMDMAQINIERDRRLNRDCYIIIFDIDEFKIVNDTYGHVAGDKVLIEITVRLKAIMRPYDLFARYGGEEFILYISEVDRNDIIEMIERFRLNICSKKFEYDGVSFNASASFGIARVSDYNLDNGILWADKALYTAKNTGRNRTILYDEKG
ncbi:MAG: sensor domain-containing diguanylate cyclase [Treponema sp.]|jgi:diguanylate cyclase (GGDEF)-like protein|nr:sensor domain-containing diguanylate cyclase [Treponema sp.]